MQTAATKLEWKNISRLSVTHLPTGGRLPTEDEDGGLLMFRWSVFNAGSDSQLTILLPAILV